MTFSDPVDTQVSGPGPVPARTEEPTIGALVHDLSQQLPDLIRSELRLAQAEVTEKGKRAGLGIGMFSVAGLLAFFGVAVLITTAILALDLVMPAWLAALIVAVVLLAAGGVVALAGKKQVAAGVAAEARAGHRGRQGRHRDREGGTGDDASPTPEQLEAEIEVQRAQLADTVDQLTQKLDVKAQAKAAASGRHHADDVRRVRRRRDPRRWPRLVAGSAMTSQSTQGVDRTEPTTPDPDDPRKPDDPTDLEKRTWWYVAQEGVARVQRRPVHRPGGGADLLRRPRHLPGRAGPQRHPRARRPVGEVGADRPRRASAPSSPRMPSARSSPRCSSSPRPRPPGGRCCSVPCSRCGRRRATSGPSPAR